MAEVIHSPFGQEHPYQQLPEERAPRLPLAGEPFVVGAVTRPSGAVNRVTVHQSVDGKALPDVEAALIADWQPILEEGVGAEYLERVTKIDQDVWQAALTVPSLGETLEYALESDGGDQTEAFCLRGEAWEGGGGAVFSENRLIVSRAGEAKAPAAPNLPAIEKTEWLSDGQRARQVRLTFRCAPDERFFGLGERFNALDQRGNVMDVRVFEQYKNQGKRGYMPIPFLLSSAGYGVWVESSRWMQFDLAASSPDVWVLTADLGADETLSLTWFTGSDPLVIVGQFTMLTGPAALPPLWAFGLWMSSNEWNSQARTIQEVETSFAHEIEPNVVVLEAWSDEATFYIWNDAQYTPKPGSAAFSYGEFTFPPDGKWPNPKAMIDWLHERGLKLVLWQNPVVKLMPEPHAQQDADRAHVEQAGLGVRAADGSLYRVRPFWFHGSYLWDVTNPAATAWWMSKRAYLIDDLGVDGFKTDGGEHLWGADTRFADGRLGDELWNEYPRHYSEAYYQFANSKRESVMFSRAGFTGSQRSPMHWAGDENSSWDAYRHSLLGGLSAGLSGIPFWGWDIGGFSGEMPSAELYLRSAAVAAFCPIMQYHSEYNAHRLPLRDRTPWNVQEQSGDTRVIPTFRFWVNVRRNLLPYIWQEAQHAAQTGQPMMRALKLRYREASDYAYYFGRDLLVFPIVEERARVADVYLPPGEWVDLWTRRRYSGRQTASLPAGIDHLPVFARAGSRIPARFGAVGEWGEAVDFSAEPTTVLEF